MIATHFIKHGGKVVGCSWTENLQAKHIMVENLNDLKNYSNRNMYKAIWSIFIYK